MFCQHKHHHCVVSNVLEHLSHYGKSKEVDSKANTTPTGSRCTQHSEETCRGKSCLSVLRRNLGQLPEVAVPKGDRELE